MKRLFIILSLFVLTTSFAPPHDQFTLPILTWNKEVSYVYVYDSKTSIAYHSKKNCKGFSLVTNNILKVTEKEAKEKYHKRACKLCE